MTKLEAYIEENGLNETEVMNKLQDHGIVSDCAVWAKDVATKDEIKALIFLAGNNKLDEHAK